MGYRCAGLPADLCSWPTYGLIADSMWWITNWMDGSWPVCNLDHTGSPSKNTSNAPVDISMLWRTLPCDCPNPTAHFHYLLHQESAIRVGLSLLSNTLETLIPHSTLPLPVQQHLQVPQAPNLDALVQHECHTIRLRTRSRTESFSFPVNKGRFRRHESPWSRRLDDGLKSRNTVSCPSHQEQLGLHKPAANFMWYCGAALQTT